MAHRPNEETITVWEKDPSVQAFKTLMDRALDKPLDRVDMQATDDWEKLAAELASARQRAALTP